IFRGETVTLRCEIRGGGTEWTYEWSPVRLNYSPTSSEYKINKAHSGTFSCRGKGNHQFTQWTHYSLTVDEKDKDVTLKHSWSEIFRGETVTLRCEIRGGGGTEWTYEWSPVGLNYSPTSSEYKINKAHSGTFSCRGKGNHQFTQWTHYSLTVELITANKPKASLTVKDTIIPVGGSVALTCSVDIGEGWKIYWFRHSYGTARDMINNKPDGFLSVSEGGVYSCRGGRGDPVFYTETSTKVIIHETDPRPAASLSVNPDRVQHFRSESVTLSCEGNSAGWRV
uniref:Ig-like domain-containing protein n=1 Tax=Poecilia formosa TaxID=48698 RepID=A0A087X551_POEFO